MPKTHEHPSVSTHWKGLIWPEALDVPFQCLVRQIVKEPSAAFLDEALTNIARARAPLERQIGRRLSKIREKRLFGAIGKSSFKDYAAERLDLGVSSAGAMARTAEALERLPVLREASDASLVTASHVRDLVRVVTPETEAEWVEKASRVTVRALRVDIKEQIAAGKLPKEANPETETETDNDSVKVSFGAPAWFRAKLATAVDLHREVEGWHGATVGMAAEAMAAEWLSGAPVPACETAEPARAGESPEDARAEQIAPASTCGPATAGPAGALAACRPGEEGLDPIHRAALERGRLHGPTIMAHIDGEWVENPARGAWEEYRQRVLEEDTDRWKHLEDDRDPPPMLPAWIKTYDGPLSDDPVKLDRELRELEHARRELDGMTGRILLTMGRVGLFKAMRFTGLGHYVRERLGMAPSTARRLQHIERLMFDLPEVRDSYYSGEIGQAKVALLIRVRESRQLTQWMARARNVTVRRLAMEVQAVFRRKDLMASGLIPEILTCRQKTAKIVRFALERCDMIHDPKKARKRFKHREHRGDGGHRVAAGKA